MKLGHTISAFVIGAAMLAPLTQVMAETTGSIQKKEDALAAAGFEPKPANTPERQAMLARLPAYKFVRRVNGDATMYVFPDPKVCNCAYVGDQEAYAAYQRQKQAKQIADEREEAAMDYQDAAWNWRGWGPWGPRWGRFGFGPGLGW